MRAPAVPASRRHVACSRRSLSVGTPVVVHDRGHLGHLVREHGIGLAVGCRDPCALREAILELAGERADTRRYEDPVARFAARFSQERFEAAAIAPFHKRL
jgi:glycosyltransferase involved in cell wall biosynthesis